MDLTKGEYWDEESNWCHSTYVCYGVNRRISELGHVVRVEYSGELKMYLDATIVEGHRPTAGFKHELWYKLRRQSEVDLGHR